MHSVDYKNAKGWKGKRGVIIGTGNTAHDVAEDMLDAGLESVTMVQRGRTAVFPVEYQKMWSDRKYSPNCRLFRTY
jgi:cation diffusion facilitator CzcD-associated flavoprotein CzcO